jgi:hypothetical protein
MVPPAASFFFSLFSYFFPFVGLRGPRSEREKRDVQLVRTLCSSAK